jgi:PTS system mannose-specific IIA component
MVNIVVVSHGNLATALIQAVEMIAGPQDGLFAAEIGPGEGAETFAVDLGRLLHSIEPEPILILVDLLGGTPYNVAARHVLGDRFECVTGANLPMLLDLVMSRGEIPLSELAASTERAGRDSIRNLGPLLTEP